MFLHADVSADDSDHDSKEETRTSNIHVLICVFDVVFGFDRAGWHAR